jgi:sirohydrochlorin ferrochelatase
VSRAPVLVGCAHGTRGAAGRRTVADVLLAVRAERPGLDVEAAFVDVQAPAVADVVARLAAAGRRSVVVPLLLSPGYHVNVDIARAVSPVAGAVAADPLGPDDRLAELLAERLRDAGAGPRDGVVLAAAGSSDPASAAATGRAVALLQERWEGAVVAGYGASAAPSVAQAVSELRSAGVARVAVAAYLLAPGHFHDCLARAGADVVTDPLCGPGAPDDRVVRIVLDRYDAAGA